MPRQVKCSTCEGRMRRIGFEMAHATTIFHYKCEKCERTASRTVGETASLTVHDRFGRDTEVAAS
jgi:transposase-like protein